MTIDEILCDEIKPCPICGRSPKVDVPSATPQSEEEAEALSVWTISCAQGPDGGPWNVPGHTVEATSDASLEEAADAWNARRRVTPYYLVYATMGDYEISAKHVVAVLDSADEAQQVCSILNEAMAAAYAHGNSDTLAIADEGSRVVREFRSALYAFEEAMGKLFGDGTFSAWEPTSFSFQAFTPNGSALVWARNCLAEVTRLVDGKAPLRLAVDAPALCDLADFVAAAPPDSPVHRLVQAGARPADHRELMDAEKSAYILLRLSALGPSHREFLMRELATRGYAPSQQEERV